MRLPNQSPPVSRVANETRDRRRTSLSDLFQGGSSHSHVSGIAPSGLMPSDYTDCYRLRGAAQQLCLGLF